MGIVTTAVVISILCFRHKLPLSADPVMVKYESTKRELNSIVKKDGPRVALDRLSKIAASDADLAGLCHALAHEVGHAAQESLGFTGALVIQDDVCGSGYVHGVIEQELADHISNFEKRFKTLCPSNDARCFHGLGHGLMYVTENNVPLSVQKCQSFPIAFQHIQCSEGVFMENFEADEAAHPSKYLFPKDPYQICRNQPEPEKGVCSFYFPRYFLRLHPLEYGEVLSFCESLPRSSAQACIKGVGSAAMKANVLQPATALKVCELVSQRQESFCIQGLLSYLIVHYASTEAAAQFCHDSLMPLWSEICDQSLSEGRSAYRNE